MFSPLQQKFEPAPHSLRGKTPGRPRERAAASLFYRAGVLDKLISRIRGEFFPKDPPTSTAVQVAGLLLSAKIEIDAVAFLPAALAA